MQSSTLCAVVRHRSVAGRIRVFALVSACSLIGLAGISSAVAAPKPPDKTPKPSDPAPAKDGAAPKFTIEEVMKKGYKGDGSLVKRIIGGKVTKDEAQLLLDLNTALAANKPDKGDAADWQQRTSALVKASEAINKGDRAGINALRTAADCKACHQRHKPD